MSKKSEKTSTDNIASGLKDSLESLQASLDEWAAVEDQVSSNEGKNSEEDPKPESRADNELMSKLIKQIENLSL